MRGRSPVSFKQVFSLQSKLSVGVLEQGPAQDGASSLACSSRCNLAHLFRAGLLQGE